MNSLAVLLLIPAVSALVSTPHSNCDGQPEFLQVVLGDCTEQPCLMSIGSTVKFDLTVQVGHNVSSMKSHVIAHAMGTDVVYPLPNSDVCMGLLNAECPLDEGEVVVYQILFPVLESFPAIPCVVTFTVESDAGVEGCMKIALQVTK